MPLRRDSKEKTYWFLDCYVGGQRKRQKIRAQTKSEAEAVYLRWVTQMRDQMKGGRYRLSLILENYTAWSIVNKTRQMVAHESNHIDYIKKFFSEDPFLDEITRQRVHEFAGWARSHGRKESGRKPLSNGSVRAILQTLRFILNQCVDYGYLQVNPCLRLRLPKANSRIKVLTKEQIALILSHAEGHVHRFLEFALYTGMRHKEILSIRWDDLDLEKGVLYLPGERTKNKLERYVILPNGLRLALLHDRSQVGDSRCEFVIHHKGKPIESVQSAWRRIRKKVQMPDLRIHDLRHVYATNLRSKGVPITDIQAALGHKTLAMTMRYAHFNGYSPEFQKSVNALFEIEGPASKELEGESKVKIVSP